MKAGDIAVRKLFGQNNNYALLNGQSEAELTALVRQGSSSQFGLEVILVYWLDIITWQ